MKNMSEIYTLDSPSGAALPQESCIYFSHIPSNRVLTIMFHTLVVESM